MHLRELDTNLLVVLDALLVETSVTRAAERLGRSPSAVSHALAKLRYLFDDDLFVRAGQRLVPTSKAVSIAPTVHVIVSGMESLLRPTRPFDPSTEKRKFSITGHESHEFSLVDRVRTDGAKLAPGIEMNWASIPTSETLNALRQGTVHLAIREDEPDTGSNEFPRQHLFDDALVTLARKDHPIHQKGWSKPSRNTFEHIVAKTENDGDSVGVQLADKLRNLGYRIQTTSSVFGALLRAAERDILVTVPQSASLPQADKLNLLLVEQPFERVVRPLYLVWHRSFDRDECHRWFRQLVAATATSDPDASTNT